MIRLRLPPTLHPSNGSELAAWLRTQCSPASAFLAALDLECLPPSRTARLESLWLTHVAVEGSMVRVDYRVEFSEFAACQDLTRHVVLERHVSGQILLEDLVFPRPFTQPVRDSVDEF